MSWKHSSLGISAADVEHFHGTSADIVPTGQLTRTLEPDTVSGCILKAVRKPARAMPCRLSQLTTARPDPS
jgi:hypothetical protein